MFINSHGAIEHPGRVLGHAKIGCASITIGFFNIINGGEIVRSDSNRMRGDRGRNTQRRLRTLLRRGSKHATERSNGEGTYFVVLQEITVNIF